MTSAHPLLVVVVAYGAEEHLRRCLAALGGGYPVVVVDNGLSDAAERVASSAGATYVRPERNLGFAAAVNLAMRGHRPAGADVLLLNPDAVLLPADLEPLRTALHRAPRIAAVGPRLRNVDGSVQKAEWPMPSPLVGIGAALGIADVVARRRFVSGAVLLLRGDAIDEIGNLDERYFLYAEEADWQLQALRPGWQVTISDDATATHASGATSSDPALREELFNASAEKFVRKWYGDAGWQVFRLAGLAAAARRLATAKDPASRATQRRSIAFYKRPSRSGRIS